MCAPHCNVCCCVHVQQMYMEPIKQAHEAGQPLITPAEVSSSPSSLLIAPVAPLFLMLPSCSPPLSFHASLLPTPASLQY